MLKNIFASIPPLREVFFKTKKALSFHKKAFGCAAHNTPLKGGVFTCLLLAIFMSTTALFARGDDQPEFAVSKMPVLLALNADAVVRLDTRAFFVESPKQVGAKRS